MLENDSNLFSNKALIVLCKSYLDATQKLEDISYAVSPSSRLIGDLFKEMMKRDNNKEIYSAINSIKIVMVKFFFHHMQQVRIDLFYLLSNWLIYQGNKPSTEVFNNILLLIKMYIVGIYTEEDAKRREEMVCLFHVCADNFDDEGNIGVLKLISDMCTSHNIKSFLSIEEEDQFMDEYVNSKTWEQTGEETINSIRLFTNLGEVAWKFYSKLKPGKRQEVVNMFTSSSNTLKQIFILSIILHQSHNEVKDKEIKLQGLPDYDKLLESSIEDINTPETQYLIERFLAKLDTQVRDFLGKLEDPEIISKLYRILKILQLRNELKWKEILHQIESIKDDVIYV